MHSCGVGCQYAGSAGKLANGQVGVFADFISDKSSALIGRQFYLPSEWTAVQVPESVHFALKLQSA
jgi:SRSO17 transposase